MAFRDVLDITVQGGKGGDGGMSFLRLKYVPKGGPDGGHGGDGGSVILESISDVSSLDRLVNQRMIKAETGGQGEGRNKAGSKGGDTVVQVPVGTAAYDIATGEMLADLLTVGQTAIIAQGGIGGRGNSSFASSRRQTPRFAELGTPGEKRRVRLELRSIADVGLVGYPNAGKSSLLAAMSNAKPEIASYPFTTLSPNLGVIERNHERFTLADIPGIIEGASEGRGLGLEFLRHISRTRLLVFVVDMADDTKATLESLQSELREYDPKLLELPSMIALNKIDTVSNDEELVASAVEELTGFGVAVMPVSALTGLGLEALRDTLFDLLPQRPELLALEPEPTHIKADPVRVVREEDESGWFVTGREIEAVVSRFDPKNREAVAYLQGHFIGMGVYKLLKKAGAQDGEEVRIGQALFEYFDEEKSREREASAE